MMNSSTTPAGGLSWGLVVLASMQGETMMHDRMDGAGWMGGYGGCWGPALLVVVLAFVAWNAMRRREMTAAFCGFVVPFARLAVDRPEASSHRSSS